MILVYLNIYIYDIYDIYDLRLGAAPLNHEHGADLFKTYVY